MATAFDTTGRLVDRIIAYAKAAMTAGLGIDDPQPDVRATTDARFGHYQINGILPLARVLKDNPRKLAAKVVEALDTCGLCLEPEIAGPGFINLRLNPEAIGAEVGRALVTDRLGITPTSSPEDIVVDFSSPNVAKRMHVGHLRSTGIGDVLVRTLRFVGHQVIGDNHVGDWGTQFGIILWAWKHHRDEANLAKDAIGELERLYKLGTAAGKADKAISDACRLELVKLQGGDAENKALWERFVAISRAEAQTIYDRMDIQFDSWHGESFYNDALPGVVEELLERGIAVPTEGAIGVFFEKGQGLPETPFLVRKSDGAFLYATSDIATVNYRLKTYGARRLVYVVDVRQSTHFAQLAATMKLMGVDVNIEHVGFGMMLGADGRPFRTRDGETIRLGDLLDEACERILPIVQEKWPGATEDEQRNIASKVGIGAVKYADLNQHLATDYKFEWDKLLAADGNTGPYLQYALVRTASVVREYETRLGQAFVASGAAARLEAPEEFELGLQLVRLGDTLERVGRQLQPHVLCEYIYTLARRFNAFYAKCQVLNAEPEIRESRMILVQATFKTIELGLSLLNLPRLSKM